jgi:hypothetical protein|tara:strand:+ start:4552 stop:4983 length:432 start_codon:yes stop_codon:yes gene_type:complete
MSKIDEKLNRVFEIAQELPGNEITPSTHLPTVDNTKDDKDADYELARNNFHLLIEKGNTAIEGILQLAREAENPRSYEVAGQLIKTVSDVTQDLMKLQKNMKDLNKVEKDAPKNVTNALFVGSTAELQKLIKGDKETKVVEHE